MQLSLLQALAKSAATTHAATNAAAAADAADTVAPEPSDGMTAAAADAAQLAAQQSGFEPSHGIGMSAAAADAADTVAQSEAEPSDGMMSAAAADAEAQSESESSDSDGVGLAGLHSPVASASDDAMAMADLIDTASPSRSATYLQYIMPQCHKFCVYVHTCLYIYIERLHLYNH